MFYTVSVALSTVLSSAKYFCFL